MKNILAIATLVILTSCNKTKETDATIDTPKPDRKEQPAVTSNEECFRWISNKDTVDMRIVRTADNIRGTLRYMWFEKDKSNGTIVGVFKRDTLRADFKFQSEGMTSLREVVFVRKGDQLVQANGEMAEKNGKMVFTGKLDLDNSISMTKMDCE